VNTADDKGFNLLQFCCCYIGHGVKSVIYLVSLVFVHRRNIY
jgi:hypothetical protein